MNTEKLIKLAEYFCKLAESLPENSKDLKVILKNIEKIDTFAARKKYAEKNLKHLSSGSSRITYLTDDKTVIKMAKNDRGIEQNKAEANPKIKSKYINKCLRHAKNFSWVEVKYIEKINEKEFEDLTGISFEDFGDCVKFALKILSSNSGLKKPKKYDDIKKKDIFKELVRVAKVGKLMPGDLSRISSYGKLNEYPILIDAGLTKAVFKEFYE